VISATLSGCDSGSPLADAGQPSFDRDSSSLQRTVVVPTLRASGPSDKSLVWCIAFEVACARMQADLFHGEPVSLEGGAVWPGSLKDPGDSMPAESFVTFIKRGGLTLAEYGSPSIISQQRRAKPDGAEPGKSDDIEISSIV